MSLSKGTSSFVHGKRGEDKMQSQPQNWQEFLAEFDLEWEYVLPISLEELAATFEEDPTFEYCLSNSEVIA
jgi:hypothetical protein